MYSRNTLCIQLFHYIFSLIKKIYIIKIKIGHSPTSRDSLYTSLKSSLSDSQLSSIYVTEDDVLDAISQIKIHKSGSCGLSSEHLKSSASAISDSLAVFFTTILRHGYMPKAFRDCVLVPIPKGSKDASCSKDYQAIALASSLRKVLE